MKRFKLLSKLQPRSPSSSFIPIHSTLKFTPFSSISHHEKTQFSSVFRNFSNKVQFSNSSPNNPENDENNEPMKIRKRIAKLNDILELNPDLIDAMIERSKCYEELSDWKGACVDLEKIVVMEHPPTDLLRDSLEKLYWLNTREENYNVKRATEHFERLFQILSNNSVRVDPFYYSVLYSLYFELSLFEKAITIATEGIKSIESYGNIEIGSEDANSLAELLCRRGNLLITKFKMLDRGRKDLERAFSISSSKYETLVLMLDAYDQVNEHELVLKTYELVKECKKNETRSDESTLGEYINLYKTMKLYFWKRKDFSSTLECMKHYYAANPDTLMKNHGLYRYLCMIVGDYAGFLESSRIYMKVFGDVTQDIVNNTPKESSIEETLQFTVTLASMYYYLNRLDDSLRECEKFKLLIETPQSTYPKEHLQGLYYIISTYSHMKKGNDSLTIEFAMQAKKFFPKMLNFLAGYYYDKGNYEMAKLFSKESYNENKDLYDLNNLACCFSAEKDFESAIQEYKKILEIDPNHALALFNMGDTYLNLNDFENARKYFDRALVLANEENGIAKAVKETWPEFFKTI